MRERGRYFPPLLGSRSIQNIDPILTELTEPCACIDAWQRMHSHSTFHRAAIIPGAPVTRSPVLCPLLPNAGSRLPTRGGSLPKDGPGKGIPMTYNDKEWSFRCAALLPTAPVPSDSQFPQKNNFVSFSRLAAHICHPFFKNEGFLCDWQGAGRFGGVPLLHSPSEYPCPLMQRRFGLRVPAAAFPAPPLSRHRLPCLALHHPKPCRHARPPSCGFPLCPPRPCCGCHAVVCLRRGSR